MLVKQEEFAIAKNPSFQRQFLQETSSHAKPAPSQPLPSLSLSLSPRRASERARALDFLFPSLGAHPNRVGMKRNEEER